MKYTTLFSICILLISCSNNNTLNKAATARITSDSSLKSSHSTDVFSDENKHFFHASGDLNKDGLADSAVVMQDTLVNTWPYTLKLYFANKDGSFTQVLATDSAIDPQYAYGKEETAYDILFDDVTIKNGVLGLGEQFIRSHQDYKFRYQHNRFELIGYTSGASDGRGTMTTIDFNLSTGHYLKKYESYETDKLISSLDTIVHINPLPDLAHFKPNDYNEGEIEF